MSFGINMTYKKDRPEQENLIDTKKDPSYIQEFVKEMVIEHRSVHTINAYVRDLRLCEKRYDKPLNHWTTNDVECFFAILQSDEVKTSTQARIMASMRKFYAYLASDFGHKNPMQHIPSIYNKKTKPVPLLEKDVLALLNAPDTTTETGIRDKAMLEMMYACGLKTGEVVGLSVEQVNLDYGWVMVFGNDGVRNIPLGIEVIHSLKAYLQVRKKWLDKREPTDALFVNQYSGGYLSRYRAWDIVKDYVKKAGIPQNVSNRDLRHTFAFHILKYGAGLERTKLLLGHKNLSSTEIYQKVGSRIG